MQKNELQKAFNQVNSGAFEVTYWDGTTELCGKGEPSFRVVFREKVPYRRIVEDPVLALGEAYMDGAIDFSGNMDEIINFATSNVEPSGSPERAAFWPAYFPAGHTLHLYVNS